MAAIELGDYLTGTAAEYHACLEACVECLVACEMCSDACLDEPDVKKMVPCIRLDRDCADACAATVRVMSRGGPLAKQFARLTAEACERCAEECEKHDSEHCRKCARACRRCAEECRKMAS